MGVNLLFELIYQENCKKINNKFLSGATLDLTKVCCFIVFQTSVVFCSYKSCCFKKCLKNIPLSDLRWHQTEHNASNNILKEAIIDGTIKILSGGSRISKREYDPTP